MSNFVENDSVQENGNDRVSSNRYYRSNSRSRRSRSRSFRNKFRSRSRSRSFARRRYSRTRSNSRPRYSRQRSSSNTRKVRNTFYRSSFFRTNLRDDPERFNPPRNNVLAVFGLDINATEIDLFDMYKKYGCNRCKVIFDKRTGKPRGFGFVYFECTDDASRAKHATDGKSILTRKIRVDYSIGETQYKKR